MLETSIVAKAISALPSEVPPSGETVFVLTASQLRTIIKEAVLEATEPLVDRVSALEAMVASQSKEIARLEALQERDTDHLAMSIAEDRQRLTRLEQRPAPSGQAGTKTLDRIEKIRAILKARGGTVSFKELRRELELKPNQFSALVGRLDKRAFQVLINPRARDEKALRLRAFA